ncbi:MAG: hypothetical protein EOO01_34375 [Chitinophagaceae bacterium]|nr:MAG: hypothetical protein EOO01_34375 [Chitinophagaceae bacterium]
MKKIITAATLCILIAACTKTDSTSTEFVSQTISDNAVLPSLSTCKVRRIYQYSSVIDGTVTAVFTYNSAGNPYSVKYNTGGTGTEDHYFFYDAQKRLTQWKRTWGDFAIRHHFYQYNAQNQIVKDSLRFSDPASGQLYDIKVSTIEYDSQGRVVKETVVNTYNQDGVYEPTRRPTYTYDNRGNLAVAGWKSSSYDYKINPLRQNRIFQFIFRNYSMNNAAVQPNYFDFAKAWGKVMMEDRFDVRRSERGIASAQ